jgi:hypothetical protein
MDRGSCCRIEPRPVVIEVIEMRSAQEPLQQHGAPPVIERSGNPAILAPYVVLVAPVR